jgi:hypothetical protein
MRIPTDRASATVARMGRTLATIAAERGACSDQELLAAGHSTPPPVPRPGFFRCATGGGAAVAFCVAYCRMISGGGWRPGATAGGTPLAVRWPWPTRSNIRP